MGPELWHEVRGGPFESTSPQVLEPASEYSYARPPVDQLIAARVISITDGDTFRALIGNQNVQNGRLRRT